MSETSITQNVVSLLKGQPFDHGNGRQAPGLDKAGGPPHDGNMDARLTALETKFEAIIPTLSTKADLGEVRADIHKVDSSIKTWMLATMLTIIGTMLAAIFGINQIYKSSQPAAASANQNHPIIIQVPTAPQQVPAPAPAK